MSQHDYHLPKILLFQRENWHEHVCILLKPNKNDEAAEYEGWGLIRINHLIQNMLTMQSCTKIVYAHIKNIITLIQVYEMNCFIIVIGGHVIHSYGRLVHREHVITRGDQLQPPGDGTGPGRMDCIKTARETAHFVFKGGKGGVEPPDNLIYQSVEDDDQMATLFFNRAFLSMNNFIAEYSCHGTYILFYLSPGNYY